MGYTTSDIRNLAFVGNHGVGKTSLAEALLEATGAINKKGSVAKGTTILDFDPQEKELQQSLDAALCHFETDGVHVHVIDTPGSPDFFGRSLPVFEAVETAAILVNAAAGVEPMAQRMMDYAQGRKLCRLIIVNKLDAPEVQVEEIFGQIRDAFGKVCLALNLPAKGGKSVVDCFFQGKGPETEFSSVEAAHTQLIEQVVEVDEELMALYLEQGEDIAPDKLRAAFAKALREGHLVPVVFCSAETGVGIKELLGVFAKLMPSPLEGNRAPFTKGTGDKATPVEVVPDASKHPIAHVFKVAIDPFVGKLGYFRVHQGTIKAGSQLLVDDNRKAVKLAHIYKMQGKEHVDVTEAVPGDICAVPKIDELHYGALLHDCKEEEDYHPEGTEFPPPMLGLAIEPEKRGDEQKLGEAMQRLCAEDPCVRVESNPSMNETVLYGLGELHLRVMLERMAQRYNAHVKTHPPSIPYKETITKPAKGHHRHKKQTGGAGQFGEVYLRIEPLPRGGGFEFVDEIVGGTIPGQYIPAVEKGVRQVLTEGAVAGFPLQDVRVIVYDGKYHSVDSKEVAFIAAGRKAFKGAILEAGPIVLEPIVRVAISAPMDAIGDISSDLSQRRGRISGQDSLPGGRAQINALVPLSELSDYQSRLKSITGGQGSYTMALSHYDPLPARKQEELAAAFKPQEEQD